MSYLVDHNLFAGYQVGSSGSLAISHLQFVDETLLLGPRSWENVRVLCSILVLFDALYGLKVNFHKSLLVGDNLDDSWLTEGLWYIVLVARYGMDGGRAREAGSRGPCWWRDIGRIQDGVSFEGGCWFEANVFRKISVEDMRELGGGGGLEVHHRLWTWEELLPTKDILVTRGVLQADDHFCIEDYGEMGSINHLFLHCSFFGFLLYLLHGWLGFSTVDPCSISYHFT
ncbi:hypothetical protein MTR_7g050660 [Medicago truncatula]|uniref:Reverse transcriptase zinc-binding domain-containing protein n=1 Tax=Medicago truncatula TaxID=3880 RepID=G7KVW2_MEDTR|nr:hypothetical protein MTR_7g050660 [Medicago truncatula]